MHTVDDKPCRVIGWGTEAKVGCCGVVIGGILRLVEQREMLLMLGLAPT